ncbi:MAG: hypothetical protein H0W73_16135 [Bacteroidetes bacterium]|nr:hypothetical protein [Bacteroidota bacterium]
MKKYITEVLEFVFRAYVFIFMSVYGLGKIMGGQFYTPERIPPQVASIPLGEAQGFELAWTFMGHSYAYVLFIGITQMLGSLLLLFNKTKLIGVAILLPVLTNIIVFDIIFLDKYGALASALIYFCMLLFILLFNKERVVMAFRALTNFPSNFSNDQTLKLRVCKIISVLIIFALIFLFDQVVVNMIGHGRG